MKRLSGMAVLLPMFCALLMTVAANAAPREAGSPLWQPFVDEYTESFFQAHPAFAVYKGRHEYDGQLPDWSKQGLEKEVARLRAQREKAAGFSEQALSTEQRFQRAYMLAAIDRQLFWLEKAQWPFRNPAFYFDWMTDTLDPSPYLTLDYAPLEQRMQAYTRYASNVPAALRQIRDNLRMPMDRPALQYGIDSFGGYATFYRDEVPGIFAAVKNPALQEAFRKANGEAAAAMAEITAWLESNKATATENYALGAELFSQMLFDTERVDIPLADLEAIGRADMKRNQQAVAEACAEFAPGKSIPDCFARMSSRKPEGGSVAGARRQLPELKAFVLAQDLVTIPGEEEARVEESPPYARSNAAYIQIPGPYEKNQHATYYLSPPNPAWPEAVQLNYIPGESDLLFTSVHEVWPGHFLSFITSNRADFEFGRVFVSYAFGEGWAHYTEEMMLQAGLRNASAETRIGQLSNALLRDARFLSAIGLHTRGMTIAQSRELFIEQAYQGQGTAEQQANRGAYDPAYLNYTLGKLMILRLREDWVAERGGREAWREFHDTFLSFGGPPIPLVRGQMLNKPVESRF